MDSPRVTCQWQWQGAADAWKDFSHKALEAFEEAFRDLVPNGPATSASPCRRHSSRCQRGRSIPSQPAEREPLIQGLADGPSQQEEAQVLPTEVQPLERFLQRRIRRGCCVQGSPTSTALRPPRKAPVLLQLPWSPEIPDESPARPEDGLVAFEFRGSGDLGGSFLDASYDLRPGALQLKGRRFGNAEAAFLALKHGEFGLAEFQELTGAQALQRSVELEVFQGLCDPSFSGCGSEWAAMLTVLRSKFEATSPLASQLAATGSAFLLAHGVLHRDPVWSDNWDGTGLNCLGLQLMLLREELQDKPLAEGWRGFLGTCLELESGSWLQGGLERWQALVLGASKALAAAVPGPMGGPNHSRLPSPEHPSSQSPLSSKSSRSLPKDPPEADGPAIAETCEPDEAQPAMGLMAELLLEEVSSCSFDSPKSVELPDADVLLEFLPLEDGGWELV